MSKGTDAFRALSASLQNGETGWLNEERKAAFDRFEQAGVPKPGFEAFKYSSVGFMNDLAPKAAAGSFAADRPDAAHLLVFVNGALDEAQSRIGDLPAGVTLTPPAELNETDSEALFRSVTLQHPHKNAFTDLNLATTTAGYVLMVADDAKLDRPLHVVFATTGDDTYAATHNGIFISAGASATVIEEHVGEGAYIANSFTMVNLGEGARLRRVRLQDESRQARAFGSCHAIIGKDARFDDFCMNTGGAFSRNDIRCELNGTGADLHLLGANLLRDKQHMDTSTYILHGEPDTTSNEVYKSVVDDNGHSVFQGKIFVAEDSQRIVGNQMSRALMLSDNARISTKPELEIYADDVICSHGATVGDLDEEALFYLRSRGISARAARNLLVAAFVQDVIEEVEDEAVADLLSGIATRWMAGGNS